MRDDLSEVSVIIDLIQNVLDLRTHTELAQMLNHSLKLLLTLGLLVISSQSDILGSVLGKDFHFQECCFRVTDSWLITRFKVHHLLLNKQSFSEPLDILGQKSIK